MKPNMEIRTLAKDNGVYQWEIAKYIGVTEQTIIRWLRNEPMLQEHRLKLIDAIYSIANREKE